MLKFINAVDSGDIYLVKKMINAGFDPSRENDVSIQIACFNGHLEIVNVLLLDKRVNPLGYFNNCFEISRIDKNYRIVERLLDDNRVYRFCKSFTCDIIDIIRKKIKQNTEIVVILKSKSFSWLPTDLIPIIMDFVCIKYKNV
jgi:hypothetical protein